MLRQDLLGLVKQETLNYMSDNGNCLPDTFDEFWEKIEIKNSHEDNWDKHKIIYKPYFFEAYRIYAQNNATRFILRL
jgi:hypothetical protein